MFNFRKNKIISEQFIIFLLKDCLNLQWIVEDLNDMGFSNQSTTSTVNEFMYLNIYCSYLAIFFYFQKDQTRRDRLHRLLINKSFELFSMSSIDRSNLFKKRLNKYISILENSESNDAYYHDITQAILTHCGEDYSESKLAAIAGKMHGKVESDKKFLKKVEFID